MKFKMENYDNDIKFNVNNQKIIVHDCDDNQIKMYNKKGILYCENPNCGETCPVKEERAICKPNDINKINDIKNTKCECSPGWEGDKCEKRIFINYT